MALCVRSVSNKALFLNGIVSSRNNTNKIYVRRSQFLEDFLSTRSSCSYQIVQKYKKEGSFDYCLLPKDQHLHVRELLNKNQLNITTWRMQTIDGGKNKVTVRVKKYTPTPDDMILWSTNANILASTNNSLYANSRLSNVTCSPTQRPDTLLDKHMVLLDSTNPTMQEIQVKSGDNTDLGSRTPTESEPNKPNEERLKFIYNILANALPRLFVSQMDYSIYHKDLVYVNNIRGTKTVGIHNFVKDIALVKAVGHLRFAFVKLDVLKITYHVEDSSIRVRWRIAGVGALKVFLLFWKFKVWEMDKMISQQGAWYDGFSTFYVGVDGLIHTHIIDKVTPDDSPVLDEKVTLAAKLALLLGLVPRSAWTDASTFLSSVTNLHYNSGLNKLAFPIPKVK